MLELNFEREIRKYIERVKKSMVLRVSTMIDMVNAVQISPRKAAEKSFAISSTQLTRLRNEFDSLRI